MSAPHNDQERSDSDRFTSRQLIEEAQREARMRRRVYGKQVRAAKMDPKEADERIDMMEAIARRLTRTAGLCIAVVAVALGAVVLADAALETALALDTLAEQARERAAW